MHDALSVWHILVLTAVALALFGGLRLGWFGPFDRGPR
jgi:hypothetical protein